MKPMPETAVLPDKFTSNPSSSSLCAAIAFMMQFGVQREGPAHLRDRLTLRYYPDYKAHNCDYLIVNAICFRSGSRRFSVIYLSTNVPGPVAQRLEHGFIKRSVPD